MRLIFIKLVKTLSSYKWLFPVVLSILLTHFIFNYYEDLEFERVKQASKDINFLFVVYAFFCLLCSHYFGCQKYSIIVNKVTFQKNNIRAGYIAYFSTLFSNIIPFGPSADICRVTMLKINHKIPISDGFLISIIDRVSSAVYVTIIGVCFLFIQIFLSFNLDNIKILIGFWLLMIVFCVCFLLLPLFSFIKTKTFLKTGLMKLRIYLWKICFNFKIAFLTILQLFFISLSFIFCVEGVQNFKYNILIILLTPFIQTVQTIPFFFSGWGIRELSFIYLIPTNGNVSEYNEIILISLLFGITLLVSVLPSILFLNKKLTSKINWKYIYEK